MNQTSPTSLAKDSPIAASSPPLTGPRGHRDYAFFYQGLAEQRLLVQRCDDCDALRNPPAPMCPQCQSLRWTAVDSAGEGTVHSYTVHHHPPLPGFASPHVIALVDMVEGFRLLGILVPGTDGIVEIGMPVKVRFTIRNELPAYAFHPLAS